MAWTGGTLQTVTLLQRPENPDYELSACKWPVLNKGDKPMYGFRNTKFFDGGIAIGGTCKDPVLAAKVLDYGYSEDGYMILARNIVADVYSNRRRTIQKKCGSS